MKTFGEANIINKGQTNKKTKKENEGESNE